MGHIIAVYGASGGAGCTTVATHLAAELLAKGAPTLLVDLHDAYADIGTFLNLSRIHGTLADALAAMPDTRALDTLIAHHASGLHILPGAQLPEVGRPISSAHLGALLDTLAERYQRLVLDLPRALTPLTQTALERAAAIVVVLTPTLLSVKNANLALRHIAELGQPAPRSIVLALNRADPSAVAAKLALDPTRIEAFLKRPLDASLPDEPVTAMKALNLGWPLRHTTPQGSALASALADLGALVHTLLEAAPAATAPLEPLEKPRAPLAAASASGDVLPFASEKPAARSLPSFGAGAPLRTVTRPLLARTLFSAYCPSEVEVGQGHTLLVYAHIEEALASMQADMDKLRDDSGEGIPQPRSARQDATIPIGTPITLRPESALLHFAPETMTKRWRKPFTRFNFEFLPTAERAGETAEVRISVQISSIEVAAIDCRIDLRAARTGALEQPGLVAHGADMFRRIFISYSPQDAEVAHAYKLAQMAMGSGVFIDVDGMRAGDDWQAAVAQAIDTADAFQLFWSPNAAQSPYCRYEWEYALRSRCPEGECAGFIRPVYWATPMHAPPPELAHLPFRYAPFALEA